MFQIIDPEGKPLAKGSTKQEAWQASGVHVNEAGNWHNEEGDTGISKEEFPKHWECIES